MRIFVVALVSVGSFLGSTFTAAHGTGSSSLAALIVAPVARPLPGSGDAESLPASKPLSGVHVFGKLAFSYPADIAVAGGHLWVANSGRRSVTEVDPKTGAVVRAIASSKYRFDRPYALAVAGGHVWVANCGNT